MGRIVCTIVVGQVAPNTSCRGCIIIHSVMALLAGSGDMRPGQRPVSIMDREGGRFPSRVGGMAVGTGSRDVCCLVWRVCTCIIIGLVTGNTGIRSVTIVSVMALVTACCNVSAGQGIVSIVNSECSWFPAGIRGMAISAGCLKSSRLVVRIGSGSKIGLVAIITFFGKTGKCPVRMAAGTIESVTQRQREKRVVNIGGVPGNAVDRMTLYTIFREISQYMIRVGGTHIIGLVAIPALHPERLKAEEGCGFVASGTVSCPVGAQQREAAALVQLGYIFHDP